MGILHSAERGVAGDIFFDQDCHDSRDEDCFLVDNHAKAEYRTIPGPPSKLDLYMEVLVKGQGDCYRFAYEYIALAPEQRRMLVTLCYIANRKGVSDSLGRAVLQNCLMVTSFMDYRRRLGYGAPPFYASCVSVFTPQIRLQQMKLSEDAEPKVVAEWTVTADPSQSAGSGYRDFVSLNLDSKNISIPAEFAVSAMTCWMDGWKRLHLEV